MKVKKSKIKIYILALSLLSLLCISFIPAFGVRTEGGNRFFGYPAEWLGLYKNGGFSFKGIGFLLNIVLFYLFFMLIVKILKGILVFIKKQKTD